MSARADYKTINTMEFVITAETYWHFTVLALRSSLIMIFYCKQIYKLVSREAGCCCLTLYFHPAHLFGCVEYFPLVMGQRNTPTHSHISHRKSCFCSALGSMRAFKCIKMCIRASSWCQNGKKVFKEILLFSKTKQYLTEK